MIEALADFIDNAGKITSGHWLKAENTEEARKKAHERCDDAHPVVELWPGPGSWTGFFARTQTKADPHPLVTYQRSPSSCREAEVCGSELRQRRTWAPIPIPGFHPPRARPRSSVTASAREIQRS